MQAESSPTLLDRVLALPSVAYADRRRLLPEVPGLYFAIRNSREVLYIGMASKSIRGRWKTWHLAVCEIDKRRLGDQVRIAYLTYSDTKALAEDEKRAIRDFRPTFNSSHVPGALERQQQRAAEECRVIDCDMHRHDKWSPNEPPTEVRPCHCIVHANCAVNMARKGPPAES